MLEGVPWFSESFFALAERTTEIAREFPNSQIVQETRNKYEALQNDLDDLRRGRIIRSGNDYELLLMGMQRSSAVVEAATNMLSARNGAGLTSWWQSDIGRHYWDLNVEAIRRGVRIIRIITYVEMTSDIADLVASQRATGVEIGLLRRGSVDPALYLNFAAFDEVGAWEARMNAHGLIVANIYTINSHDVGRIRGAFNACRIAADFSSNPRELPAH
jgi:hypothetical protein